MPAGGAEARWGAAGPPEGAPGGAGEPEVGLEEWLRLARAAERPHLGPEGWERGGLAAGEGAARWRALRGRLQKPVPPERAAERVPVGGAGALQTVGRCEAEGTPCVLEGGMEAGWDLQSLSFPSLLGRFGAVPWRLSDVHGELLTLEEFQEYVSTTSDDAPLGIYESQFHREPTTVISDWYTCPQTPCGEPVFSPDLFALSEGRRRPPWRWVLVGAERSGTGMHVDPLYTSAWVALVEGLKRWVMFPPSTEPQQDPEGGGRLGQAPLARAGEPQLEAAHWFLQHYDAVGTPAWPGARPVEILQRPGEVVYVPQGWHHVVVNLELSVAVTHNWASERGQFGRLCEETCREEPRFARSWARALGRARPDLARRAAAAAPPGWAASPGSPPSASSASDPD